MSEQALAGTKETHGPKTRGSSEFQVNERKTNEGCMAPTTTRRTMTRQQKFAPKKVKKQMI